MTWKIRFAVRMILTAVLTALALAHEASAQTATPAGGAPAAPGADAAMNPPPPAPSATLTPPRLLHFIAATLPATASAALQATGAEVELELTLDPTGTVTDVRVVTAVDADLDQAAVAAARQFTFEPAHRGSQAIPARIRYRYAFEPPAPPPPTTGTLEGRVLDRQGKARLGGVDVTLRSANGQVVRDTTTDSEGGFQFGELPEGKYHVQIGDPQGNTMGARASDEEVTAGDLTSVTYRLEPSLPTGEKLLAFGATATVEAPPREVTKRSLKTEELLRVAGTRGDALRAIEYMPGVARGEGDFIIIRGSAPEDSEVQFEGAPVFRLYHFGGLTSFVHSRMLEHIDLYPGNFSARYGRKLGGIVDVGVRDPRTDGYHAIVDLNVLDSSFLAEGPIGNRASIAFAVKRSYIDLFFDKLMPADIGVTAAPVYWDYQLLATYRPTDRDRLRAMIYGSYDDFKLVLKDPADGDPMVRGNVSSYSGFHRGQVAWKHSYNDRVEHDITVTAGQFSYGQAIGPELTLAVPGFDVFTRAEWRARLHDRVRLMGGLDIAYTQFHGKYFGPAVQQLDGNPSIDGPLADNKNVSFDRDFALLQPAAYVEMLIEPVDGWQIVPGARVDHFGGIQRWSIDPRITSRYELQPGTTLKGGVGLFTQAPDLTEILPVVGNPHLQTPRGQHYGLGIDQKVGDRLLLTLDGFYKRLDRLVVNSPVVGENLNNDGIGRIYGGEASARLAPSRRMTGFLSYTFSHSQRNDHNEGWRLFNWDQTHILTVAGSLRLGEGWDLSSTFRYVSGNPLTPVADSTYNANTDLYRPIYGAINSARNPAFHRLDLRIEKIWRGKAASIATYLDVQNVYNRRNQEGRAYNYDFRRSEAVPGLPVIPSIGLRGEI